MRRLVDIARFRADDPCELVSASLACPVCLHGEDVEWEERREDYDDSVRCHCRHCDETWSVYMQPHQLLRLDLMRTSGR